MSLYATRRFILPLIMALVCAVAVSCNSKTDDDETEIAVTPSMVAVKNFVLQKNDSVLAQLDSVFFSIDLNTGVIFNADSLPKGTDVTRLIPVITFANNMQKAELEFLKDNKTDTVVNYLSNPTDSIDFTHPVTLNVTAADGLNSFSYQIKVNVHTVEPDSLVWNRMATSILPSRLPNPKSQKTLVKDDVVYCFIEESDGSYTVATSTDLNAEGQIWEKSVFSPGFVPDIETFTATPSAIYALNAQGTLYYSYDLTSWISTDEDWVNILGAYGESILGIMRTDGQLMFAQYPQQPGFVSTPLPTGFPIYHYSSMGEIESEWADSPIVILYGGMTAEGNASSAVWAYDGTNWADINESSLPALEAPMMVQYVVYRDTPRPFIQREFEVWLMFGGFYESGEMNREVYVSYDNGVRWSLAPEAMQLSDKVPTLEGADLIVAYSPLTTDLSEAWTPMPQTKTRASYTIDGTDVTWQCPYLYIFGGYNPYPGNSLNTNIYRGVLQRLKFTPSI